MTAHCSLTVALTLSLMLPLTLALQSACVRPPRGLHGHAHGVIDPVVSRHSLDMQARALACPMQAPYLTTRTRLTPQLR